MAMRDRQRRWPIRIAQSSPLIALALVVGIVLSLPLPFSYGLWMLVTPAAAVNAFESGIEGSADLMRAVRMSQEAGLSGTTSSGEFDPSSFAAAAQETWFRANAEPAALAGLRPGAEAPFAAGSEVYAPVLEWGSEHGADVWAWVARAPETPPLVASARGRGDTRTELQPIWPDPTSVSATAGPEPLYPDVTDDGTDRIAHWLWREAHQSDTTVPALDPAWFSRMSGGGTGTEGEEKLVAGIVAGGEAWRAIVVSSIADQGDPTAWPVTPPALVSRDPRAADYEEWLDALAREHEMDIWVFGPLRSELVPLRAPDGRDSADAAALGEMVWPSAYLEHTSEGAFSTPFELEGEVAALAGGAAGALTTMDWTHSSMGQAPGPGGVAPQTILYMVVWDEMPVDQPGAMVSAWYEWQRFVGRNVRVALGLGYGALLVSAVAGPVALLADRRRRIAARAAEERERMHRDAHDKVYNRLSALSKRVASVGDVATNGTAETLAVIAEDIRATVGELQGILGDDGEHIHAALASVPLEDQIAAVCGAQAARLGIAVECTIDPGTAPVSPQLGWDLQCIAEEAITNAARHGGATQVKVEGGSDAVGRFVLVIEDNGSGSAVRSAAEAPEGSTGLKGMAARASRHGGRLELVSDEEGATVTVIVPLADTGRRNEV